MRARGLVGALTGVLVLVLAGCTGGGAPKPSGTSGASASGAGSMSAAQYLAAVQKEAPDPTASPVAAADGTIDGKSVSIAVLSVTARSDSTLLTYVLRGPEDLTGKGKSELGEEHTEGQIRAPALVSVADNLRLRTVLFNPTFGGIDAVTECACVSMHRVEPTGSLLTAWFGPLPTGTGKVTVQFPGVPDIGDVPVTWANE